MSFRLKNLIFNIDITAWLMKIYKIKLLGQLIDLHNDDDHAKDRNYKNNKNTTIIT